MPQSLGFEYRSSVLPESAAFTGSCEKTGFSGAAARYASKGIARLRRKTRPAVVARISSRPSTTRPSAAHGSSFSRASAKSLSKQTPYAASISAFTITPWQRRFWMTVRRSRSSSDRRKPRNVAAPPAADVLLVGAEIAAVLDVGRPDAADRAHPEADEIRPGLGRVPLKVAVERPVGPRPGELVGGPREVVHADVLEAGAGEPLERRAEDLELRPLIGQVRLQDALVLLHPRHVRVRIDGEAVGSDRRAPCRSSRRSSRRSGTGGRRSGPC